MSIDQALLDEFYGSEEQSNGMVKEAQAELVESVADEAGVDLNTMTDDELDKFAEYVLTPEGAEEHLDPNLATADAMGRQMAHSFTDEQEKLAHFGGHMYDDILMEKAAEWEFIKEAKKGKSKKKGMMDRNLSYYAAKAKTGLGRATGYRDIMKGRRIGESLQDVDFNAAKNRKSRQAFENLSASAQKKMMGDTFRAARSGGSKRGMGSLSASGAQLEAMRRARKSAYIRGGAKATAATAALGGLGYLAMREKKSSYDPSVEWIEDLDGYEFAKLAEFRAAEILAANGVDPETFEEIYPEHIKVANFPEPEDAHSWEAAEDIEEYNDVLDDAALDILEDLGLV